MQNNTQVRHTPTPFYATQLKDGWHIQSTSINEDNYVCHVYGTLNDEANAQFIVKAVNCHEKLVDLVKEFYDYSESILESSGEDNGESKIMKRIEKLLKKVGE